MPDLVFVYIHIRYPLWCTSLSCRAVPFSLTIFFFIFPCFIVAFAILLVIIDTAVVAVVVDVGHV